MFEKQDMMKWYKDGEFLLSHTAHTIRLQKCYGKWWVEKLTNNEWYLVGTHESLDDAKRNAYNEWLR